MKRIYQTPQTQAMQVAISVTLCASGKPGFSSKPATPGAGL